MQISLALMSNIASMLIWVLLGYIAVRTGLVKGEHSKVLSTLTIYVFCPAMIFNAFQIELTSERLHGFLACTVFAFVAFLVWIGLSRLLRKPLGLHPVEETSLVYGNVGYLVLPLVQMTLGDEMVLYASAMQIPFNLFFWTHGISVIQGSTRFEWKKLVTNVNLWALFLGLLFMSFQWHLPKVLDTSVTGLARLVAPISMLVVGMVLADAPLRTVFSDRRAFGVVAGRLLLFPLVPVLLFWVSHIPQHHPELVSVLLVSAISFSAPSANNVSQLAVVFDEEPEHAGGINILSHLACVLTMPLFIAMYQALFS